MRLAFPIFSAAFSSPRTPATQKLPRETSALRARSLLPAEENGGRGRIRTSVARKERQIYSLLVLATHPPVRTGGSKQRSPYGISEVYRDTNTLTSRCRKLLPAIIRDSSPAKEFWQSWRRDLNPRPSDYKSDALPTELRQHGANRGNITKGNFNCKVSLWKTCANLTTWPKACFSGPHPPHSLKSVLEAK